MPVIMEVGWRVGDDSVVQLAVPMEWLGDGAAGIGVNTPITQLPKAPPPETVSTACALCGEAVQGVVKKLPEGLEHDELMAFLNAQLAAACPHCDAVFCSKKSFHRKQLHGKLFKGFESGSCTECGRPLEGAARILRQPNESHDWVEVEESVIDAVSTEAACSMCDRQFLGRRVDTLPEGLTTAIDEEFRRLVEALVCRQCGAVFCNKDIFHWRETGVQSDDTGAGHCQECGASFRQASFILCTAEHAEYLKHTYETGTAAEYLDARLPGDGPVRFPQRCVTCGSEDLTEPYEIDLRHDSEVSKRIENMGTLKQKAVPVYRKNTACFQVPFCRQHLPQLGQKLKTGLHQSLGLGIGAESEVPLEGLTVAFSQVWEPTWRPRLLPGRFVPGESASNARDFLTHPIWFFTFKFADDAYRRDFAEENRQSIEYLWDAFTEEIHHPGPITKVARHWVVQPGRVIHAESGWVHFYLAPASGRGGEVRIAGVKQGKLGVYTKRLRKKCHFTDTDIEDLEKVMHQALNDPPITEGSGRDSGLYHEFASVEVGATTDILDWVAERIDQLAVVT